MRLKSRIPFEVDVEGEKLKLSTKRLNYEEASKLRAQWKEARSSDPQSGDLWGALLVEAFRFVRVESELVLEAEDGDIRLKKGEDLLAAFGGANMLLTRIFIEVLAKNTLADLEKNDSPSRADSKPSSDERAAAVAGGKPETTATSAASADSASSGDAPAPQESSPSGSMAEAQTESQPSSSTNAPSVP